MKLNRELAPSAAAGLKNSMLQVVVVTVCLEPRICRQIVDAVDRMSWLVDMSHLDSYSSATRRPAFGPQMKAAGRGIAVIDFTQNIDQALDCARYLVQTFGSQLAVVAVGDDQRPDIILEAVRAGCSEYLPADDMDASLRQMLRRFAATWSERVKSTGQQGSVLALLGAKGGVGTTALAVHLAVALSTRHGKRVLLVDTQPEFGHVCLHLGVDGAQYTFAEVVSNVSRLDSDLLQGFMARHSASGLCVLSSPDQGNMPRPLHTGDVAKTLEFLRSEFDYIVIDSDRSFTGLTQTILDAASRTYLVTTPEVCALRDASRHLDRLMRDEQLAERLQLVLNRDASKSGLKAEQIERSMRLPIHVRIPNDYPAMVEAGNVGKPLVPQGKSEVAQALLRWSDGLVQLKQPEAAAEVRSSTSFFSRIGAGRGTRKGAAA